VRVRRVLLEPRFHLRETLLEVGELRPQRRVLRAEFGILSLKLGDASLKRALARRAPRRRAIERGGHPRLRTNRMPKSATQKAASRAPTGCRFGRSQRRLDALTAGHPAERLHKIFDINDRDPDRPFFFSHLYTAIARTQFREYLGLPEDWRENEPESEPVPKKRLERLGKLLGWIYGSYERKLPPLVTSQNPNLKQLGDVLAHPVALKRLEATRDLKQAFAEVETRGKKFEESLLAAVRNVEDAQKFIDGYEADEALLEYAGRLVKMTRSIFASMEQAPKPSTEDGQ
jgi:hypothetical protein